MSSEADGKSKRAEASQRSPESKALSANSKRVPECGLVMPIADWDSLTSNHWVDVKAILTEALETAGLQPKLVSDAHDVEMIHQSIILNLNTFDLVVCDVSCGNPNVMLELGLRLAFDKPTIIVKDEITPFRFDSSPIRTLVYPRDLRYGAIQEFKKELAQRALSILEKVESNQYTTFLSQFKLTPAEAVASDQLKGDPPIDLSTVLRRLDRLSVDVRRLTSPPPLLRTEDGTSWAIFTPELSDEVAMDFGKRLVGILPVKNMTLGRPITMILTRWMRAAEIIKEVANVCVDLGLDPSTFMVKRTEP